VFLTRLDLHAVRNLAPARLALGDGVTLVTGDNGSGKTSLLEAVWLLGTGRSFRSNRVGAMIRYGAASMTVFAEATGPEGAPVSLGIRRERSGESEIKVAGRRVAAASALAAVLPVQLVNPDSVELVTGSPGRRRRFLDWGTFHVEQGFLGAWKAFRRSLDQRNALLRSGASRAADFALWERQLVAAATEIDAQRSAYVAALRPGVEVLLEQLGGPPGVALHYARGWDAERDLGEVLADQRAADREAGFTRAGPQRADLRLVAEGRRAAEVLSRGQQKILACALLIAQGRLLEARRGRSGVTLVDDLPAELDAEHRLRLGRALASLHGQVLVTAVQRDLVIDGLAESRRLEAFHVEQGRIDRA
jgi:DNA replication and repair protein RecF